jgi:hypothetical protein
VEGVRVNAAASGLNSSASFWLAPVSPSRNVGVADVTVPGELGLERGILGVGGEPVVHPLAVDRGD